MGQFAYWNHLNPCTCLNFTFVLMVDIYISMLDWSFSRDYILMATPLIWLKTILLSKFIIFLYFIYYLSLFFLISVYKLVISLLISSNFHCNLSSVVPTINILTINFFDKSKIRSLLVPLYKSSQLMKNNFTQSFISI